MRRSVKKVEQQKNMDQTRIEDQLEDHDKGEEFKKTVKSAFLIMNANAEWSLEILMPN